MTHHGHHAHPSESKADLVSIEVKSHHHPTFTISSRTKLERILIGLVALLALALVVVAIVLATRGSNEAKPDPTSGVCMTPTCIKTANTILQNMDTSVDPCDDFYQYACGGFEKRIRIPDDRTSRSQFSLIDDDLDEQLRDILEANETINESKVFRMAHDEYVSCMDTDRLEEIGLKPLEDILEKFGGWPAVQGDQWNGENFDWQELNVLFRKNGYSTDYLFDFSISTDPKNSSYRTIFLDEALLGMHREYLVKGFEHEDVQHYYNYMQNIAVMLGADPEIAARDLKDSLTFEIKLANISLPREERRNASKLYHPMKLNELGNIAPFINDWPKYVNRILTEDVIQVPSDERVVVTTPEYFKNLTEILNEEPKRNIANYMLWRVARSSIGFLNKQARDIAEEYARNVTGKKESAPRWKGCVGAAAGSFSAAVGKMYVIKHFDKHAKEVMVEMVKDIKVEFSDILNEITWMDPTTKESAHEKLSTMKDYIGYPEEILNNSKLEELYKGLEIDPNEYFDNGIRMSIWSTNYHWKKLREEVDKTDWKRHANPAVVNAFYSAIENSIQFPAGILQGIFFGKDRPNYANYGGIGWVIGHEITHGFDDQGRQFDAEGNLKNWWDEKTMDEFLKKTKCIIWQYGNYSTPIQNLTLNGINTQGENIADNGGIKEAYRAYKRWVSRHGEEPILPGLNHTQNQLFWISAANTWCSKYRPKALEQRILTGAHSPGPYRVKGPFSNSKEFSNDFQCKSGSAMNPIEKCEVW